MLTLVAGVGADCKLQHAGKLIIAAFFHVMILYLNAKLIIVYLQYFAKSIIMYDSKFKIIIGLY